MTNKTVHIDWQGDMSFETELDGHTLYIDAAPEVGGNNKGPRPKAFMLLALAGCTGMDVVSMLKKMRVEFDALRIYVEAEQTENHPKHYSSMKVIYEFKGKDLPMKKIERAVTLSQEEYCGVNAVYKKAIPVTSEIRVVE